MAEAKTAPTPAPAAVPEVSAAPKTENAFLKAVSRLLSTTFFLVSGFVCVLFGILAHEKHWDLGPVTQMLNEHQWKLTYLLVGLGLILIAQARINVYRLYSEEAQKNRNSAHGWKIPLVVAQILMFQLAGLYGFLVGFDVIKNPVRNLMFFFGIVIFILAYLFWYLIAHFFNRYKNLAGLQIARTALILAVISFIAWNGLQFVLLSLLAGFFSVLALLISLGIAPFKKEETRGNWIRPLYLMLSVLLLLPVGLAANPIKYNIAHLIELGPAAQNLTGQIDNLTYTPDSKKIAFTQKNEKGWFLCLLDPEATDNKIVNYQAGDGAFTPVFVNKGSSVLLDILKGSTRDLYLLTFNNNEPQKSTLKALTHSGVELIKGGIPWSESKQQFLYVTKTLKGFQLNALFLPTGKSVKVFESAQPILSPAWVSSGYQIAYTDGICERPYIYDQELKISKALFSDDERAQIAASGGKLRLGLPATEVLPSNDAFRYLFKCVKDDVTVLETALADGSKANEVYRSFQPIDHLSWMDLGQKIIFEEAGRQAMYFRKSKQILIEEANQTGAEMESLIWPQISHHSPAPSPDGVKVAFVGSSGLWYPSFGLQDHSGIWVAVLH